MQIMHYRQAHSLSRRVMPLCSRAEAEGARPSEEKTKKTKKKQAFD